MNSRCIWIFAISFLLYTFPCAAAEYLPGVKIGSNKASNFLVFIWHPTCEACLTGYRENILPLFDSEVRDQRLIIFLAQATDSSAIDLQTGALFMCGEKSQYGPFVTEYLRTATTEVQKFGTYIVRTTAVVLGNKFGLPSDLAKCLNGKDSNERKQAIIDHSRELRKNFLLQSFPAYVLNGKRIDARSPDDIRSELLK